MTPKAILIAVLVFGLNAVAHGAKIHDKPDLKWAPRGGRTSPGWDIIVDGAIVPGDDVRFGVTLGRVIKANPNVWPVIVWLNSPGGDVVTSVRIADQIDRSTLWTHVDGLCASSCFLLFMAGKALTFSPNSKIGVHSAYEGEGMETPLSLEATMILIRKAQAYRLSVIPPSIIGKLAGTLGSQISWLSREELQQIGATMDPPEAASTEHTPTVMQRAQAFATRYTHDKPDYAAKYGGQDGVSRQWLDSYDEAYSKGISPGDCGNGFMPDTAGCLAGASDYLATHRTR